MSMEHYLPHIHPPPFLQLPLSSFSCLSDGSENSVSWLQGSWRVCVRGGGTSGLDAGKRGHISTFF